MPSLAHLHLACISHAILTHTQGHIHIRTRVHRYIFHLSKNRDLLCTIAHTHCSYCHACIANYCTVLYWRLYHRAPVRLLIGMVFRISCIVNVAFR